MWRSTSTLRQRSPLTIIIASADGQTHRYILPPAIKCQIQYEITERNLKKLMAMNQTVQQQRNKISCYMFRYYNCAFICLHCGSSGVFKMVRCKQHRQTCFGTTIVPSFVFTAVQVVFSKWYAVSSTVTLTCFGTTIVPSFVFTAVQVVFSKWSAVSSTVRHVPVLQLCLHLSSLRFKWCFRNGTL